MTVTMPIKQHLRLLLLRVALNQLRYELPHHLSVSIHNILDLIKANIHLMTLLVLYMALQEVPHATPLKFLAEIIDDSVLLRIDIEAKFLD